MEGWNLLDLLRERALQNALPGPYRPPAHLTPLDIMDPAYRGQDTRLPSYDMSTEIAPLVFGNF